MEYPYNLPKEEVIRRIKHVYNAESDLENKLFDVYDQLLACESLAESENEHLASFPLNHSSEDNSLTTNVSVHVNGNGNGARKQVVNSELSKNKHKVITELEAYNYKTPPIKISKLLEQLFVDYKSKDGHWLYIAQNWNPRAINRVIRQMSELHQSGQETIKNPAAYFTHLIKFRKKRRRKQNHAGGVKYDH